MSHLHKTNLTPEQRQARYSELHPIYDHSQTDFTAHGTQFIDVSCNLHGPFITTAKLHLKQIHTCPDCLKQSKLLVQPPTWRKYQNKQLIEMIPWTPSFDVTNVSISQHDYLNGSPKQGDFIARGPDHSDMWLIAAQYHKDNYQIVKEK